MCSITPTLTRSMRPTKPMSSPPGAVRRATRNSEPSSPHRPTAGWPWRLRRSTISLLTLPTSTILATSTVFSSETRSPPTNSHGQAEALHVAGDLRAAAVDDDRVQPDVLEQHDVARELLAQRRVLHRGAAVLDHDRLAVELPDVGERLEQRSDVAHSDPLRHIPSPPSCRVVGVDRHVLVREVGEEDLGLGALAGQADLVLDLRALAPRAASAGSS